MSLITCSAVGISFGAVTVLSDVELRVEERERLAVVGGNGAGKSSLLDVLAGVAPPSAGRIERSRRLISAYLPQNAPAPVAPTVLAEAMASRRDLSRLRAELEQLEQAMGRQEGHLEAQLERYGEAQHAYEGLGGYDLESRARATLGGLGLDDEAQARPPGQLSGGQVRRLELAKLLLQDAELMLVDEPTNHLDLGAIEWLEDFLRTAPAAMVLVSHDRRFIDSVCGRVLELGHGVAEEYPGNWTQYSRLRLERRARRAKEFEAQQAYIAHQEEFIRRYRAGQRAKQARGRQTLLDRLDRADPVLETRRPRLRFMTAPTSNVLLRTAGLDAGRGTPLVRLDRAVIAPGDRIAIVGPNGCGKSTLLHTLAGELPSLGGELSRGARCRLLLYRQDHGHLDPERSVLQELLADHPVGEERGRTLLGSLLFEGDEADAAVGSLSGGERARLALGKLALEESNLLLLDEPTNHLDIPAQEVLEEAVGQYPGAVILVSHDRALIDAVATRVWAIEPMPAPTSGGASHRVREVLGGYSELLRVRAAERASAPTTIADPGAGSAPAESPAGRRVNGARHQPASSARGGVGRARGSPARTPAARAAAAAGTAPRSAVATPGASARRERAAARVSAADVSRLEQAIAEAERRLAAARDRLQDPATFRIPQDGADAGRDHERLSDELGALYDRWTELAD